ncbi:pyridoxal phosphate-dependent aminotransferase [Sphingoaurantiacus capsulatus]|uniref:Pyridoxal phosphate-dependent aminotransferase n=1 Tax=Sphingoaurantiacus capsulatus TaxID=1771310 RepID=A0ABV7X7Y4_9SPHN
MATEISRRLLLGAASAGTALVVAGRSHAQATPPRPLFGPAAGVAQLSRNENPYGPSPAAIEAMARAASQGCYYPDAGIDRLTAMIAERNGVGAKQVVIGAGSTELLSSLALAWMSKGAILCPDLFWDTTVAYAAKKGAKVKRVPMKADMSVDLDALAAAITPDVGMIHLCNPNNPTGILIDSDALRAFLRKVPSHVPVLIDEAYNELTARPDSTSVVGSIKAHPNVVVARTFSKIHGLAGLRIGYVIASEENAATIDSYVMSMGGTTAGIAAAIATYDDQPFLNFSKARIVEARGMIYDAVRKAGLTALPAETNFVFVKVPDADAMKKALAERQIVVRGAYGPWKQWSRVSTGKIEDVKRYCEALPQVVGA